MIYLTVILIYLVVMAIYGAILSRQRVKTDEDFVVAGRRLPFVILVGTLLATWMGSGTVVGGANFVYNRGFYAGFLFFVGAPIGIMVLWTFADRIRTLGKFTIPQIIEVRYGSTARLVASLCILAAYVGIVSYQYTGMGYILSLCTGIPLRTGATIAAAFIILYAAMGGMVTVAYTDFISAFLMVAGLLIAIPAGLSLAGGWSNMVRALPATHLSFTGGLTCPQLIGYVLPLLFLILGDQNMYQRYSAAASPRVAKNAAMGFFWANLFVAILVVISAVVSRALWPDIKGDTALMVLAMKALPPILGGVVLAGILTFIITTGDSYLLSCANNLTYDIYVKYINPGSSHEKCLLINRVGVVALGILAYILGTFFPTVLAIQMYSYTMYGATVTPAVLAAFLWKRATPSGALSSIVVGAAATLTWELLLKKPGGLNSILFALPLSILALVLVSFLTPPPSEETVEAFTCK